MGLCVSSDASSRGGRSNAKHRGKHNNRRRSDRRHTKRHEESSSESHSSSEGSGSDSDSDSEARRRRKRRQKRKEKEEQDANGAGAAGGTNNFHQNGRVIDSAAYAVQYPPISQEDQNILFYNARTCTRWAGTPVPHEILRNAMKLALLAPSAYNCCPMRVVFVTQENTAAKEKLLSTVDQENQLQTQEAPVVAIVCTDLHYTRNLPKLMPYVPNAQQMFEQYDDLNEMIRIRNSNLQAGYLILALRSLGLAVGPVSGFDNQKCDELFLEGSSWKSNFLINLGYAKDDQYAPRAYRLPFDVAAKLL